MDNFTIILKYFLIAFNVLFTIVGVTVIALGVYAAVTGVPAVGGMVIALGAVIFIISICGGIGAITQIICLLITYAVLLLILAMLKILLAAELHAINKLVCTDIEKITKGSNFLETLVEFACGHFEKLVFIIIGMIVFDGVAIVSSIYLSCCIIQQQKSKNVCIRNTPMPDMQMHNMPVPDMQMHNMPVPTSPNYLQY